IRGVCNRRHLPEMMASVRRVVQRMALMEPRKVWWLVWRAFQPIKAVTDAISPDGLVDEPSMLTTCSTTVFQKPTLFALFLQVGRATAAGTEQTKNMSCF